ncbi:hypothetical protein AS9A_2260 [Hoyosella subflava DQS3-9A1]|uniref:Vanillate O-demethylase oxygenase-like C-terminal catalytic domain-containing protein n=1 Tax=Hoyosella subflava (strain DSM 45089 / JCM 17490 / NBRC 109087 / DQS3-9A1) TaxID=443218 RepID=F6ER20_HOYSD|nr:hypothetical protein AS9A_2260 [Hoyosella subflava DQS3-9A1]
MEENWTEQAHYMMVHEHYLDFSYAPVLHRDELPRGIDQIPPVDAIEVTETTVAYRRHFPAVPLAPWEAEATGLDPAAVYGRRESGLFASPALHIQSWEIDAGDRAYSNRRTHAITPETEDSTHVFMQASYNYGIDDATVAEILGGFASDLIERDRKIVEMATTRVGYNGWRASVEFAGDAAALHARRIVSVMRAKESGRSPLRPGFSSALKTQSITTTIRP